MVNLWRLIIFYLLMLVHIDGIVFSFDTWVNLAEKIIIVIIHGPYLLNSMEYKSNLNVDLLLFFCCCYQT